MQGWRKRMEDAHIAILNIGSNKTTHVFGVFDGHGGKEVAQFVKAHFGNELVGNKSFNNNLKTALIETFIKIDELLIEPNGKTELKKYAKISKEEDEIISQKEKSNKQGNSQMDFINQMFNKQDDIDIAMMTGCTSCVVAVDEKNKNIYCANAGDSRAVLCRKGVAYALSTDHKPELETEKTRIYKADGWVSEGRIKGNDY
jgi:serine/threonine protein phosphatase PrpC